MVFNRNFRGGDGDFASAQFYADTAAGLKTVG